MTLSYADLEDLKNGAGLRIRARLEDLLLIEQALLDGAGSQHNDLALQRLRTLIARAQQVEKTIKREEESRRRREIQRQWKWRVGMGTNFERYFEALGLSYDAGFDRVPTFIEVQRAYRQRARECHPDHGGSDEAMTLINEAYEVLMESS